MPVRDLSELDAATRAFVESYLERTAAGFCEVANDVALEALDDIRAHVLGELEPGSSVEDARATLKPFGEPDELAVALCREVADGAGETARERGAGTVFGMPYDVRFPTPGRVQSRWWDPQNPAIWVPKTFGVGWTINFGALAVRTGLIRPDDEDVPFALVPEAWLRAALALPVLIVCGMAAAWWRSAATLPAELPIHWNFEGTADGFAPAANALGFLMAMAVVPTAWAIWGWISDRSHAARALTAASAALFAVLAGGIFAMTLAWTRGWESAWATPAIVLLAVGVPFGVLVGLARVNRREEWRRQLRA